MEASISIRREVFSGISHSWIVMKDFESYYEAKLKAIRDAGAADAAFARKCLMNIAHAGKFSSDRTIRQYAKEIWNV